MSDEGFKKLSSELDKTSAMVVDLTRKMTDVKNRKFLWTTVQVGQFEYALVRLNVETGESERVKL